MLILGLVLFLLGVFLHVGLLTTIGVLLLIAVPTPPDASRAYRRYLSAVLLHGHASAKACDLHATDLYALNILELAGPMTPGELGTRTGLTTGPTTRLVDRLEAAGYVRRAPDPGDRRKVIVEP